MISKMQEAFLSAQISREQKDAKAKLLNQLRKETPSVKPTTEKQQENKKHSLPRKREAMEVQTKRATDKDLSAASQRKSVDRSEKLDGAIPPYLSKLLEISPAERVRMAKEDHTIKKHQGWAGIIGQYSAAGLAIIGSVVVTLAMVQGIRVSTKGT